MSVFVCSDVLLNAIEETLFFAMFSKSTIDFPYWLRNDFDVDPLRDFVDTLHSLNQEAYAARYRENLTLVKRQKTKRVYLNNYELLKQLKCLRYQLQVNEVKAYRDLTEKEQDALDKLNDLICHLTEWAIDQVPEFKAAKWGIE